MIEVQSFGYSMGDVPLQQDLNGDGWQDEISCGFWRRWGRLSDCEADLEDGNVPVTINANCKRLGVVDQVTNEMKDLLCNADPRLTYNSETDQYE